MYRVLIVSNEETMMNGLYFMLSNFNTKELDVYKAYSGVEAIQWLARTRIDIVLIDIHMPEINGLQLLKEIKIRWPWCRIIFFTDHDKFEYAYNAIQYKGVRYLLKTEGYHKILRTVEVVIQELDDENSTNQLIQNAKDQINLVQDFFLEKYFYALLNKESSLKLDKEEFERLHIPLKSDVPVTLILGELWGFPDDIDFWEKSQILHSIKQLIMKHLCINVDCLVSPLKDDKIAIFVQSRRELIDIEKVDHDLDLFLKRILKKVQSVSREKTNTSIHFVLAKQCCEWKVVAEKYSVLMNMLRHCMGQTVEIIIGENEYDVLNRNFTDSSSKAEKSMLKELLYQDDLSDLYCFAQNGRKQEYMEVLEYWTHPVEQTKDKSEVITIEEKLSTQLFDFKNKDQDRRAHEIIEFVQQYIVTHLSEDLSLNSLSEKVFLNASYLSRIYHQTTGHKLSVFIEVSRVKEAKTLLQNPHEKIYEVAKKVGYDTSASFTRLFKKLEGVSPQEYRDTFIVQDRKVKKCYED